MGSPSWGLIHHLLSPSEEALFIGVPKVMKDMAVFDCALFNHPANVISAESFLDQGAHP